MIVSPDIGGVVRARAVAKSLGVDLAIIDKRRPKANQSEVMHIIGDVDGRTCVLVDDMVDTAGTLGHAAKALKDHGAAKVYAYCTHPVLSGRAIENIENSVLDELVVTNTIPCPPRHRPARVSANWISRRSWLKRSAASAMRNRSARCSAKDIPDENARPAGFCLTAQDAGRKHSGRFGYFGET